MSLSYELACGSESSVETKKTMKFVQHNIEKICHFKIQVHDFTYQVLLILHQSKSIHLRNVFKSSIPKKLPKEGQNEIWSTILAKDI